jgi:hypothetical protein
MKKKLIKPIRIFKKYFGLVWFRFHKPRIKKPNQTGKNSLENPKKAQKQYNFQFLI